jgi:hypothetical protein
MANTIAEYLSQSGHLRGYTIDIAYKNGTVELSGTVADQPQREEVLRIVQGVPGVERVRNNLMLTQPIQLAQSPLPPGTEAQPLPGKPPEPPPPVAAGPIAEPMPIFQAPPPSAYDMQQPKMPPYAWPTYAPYNNYSRVAYPLMYPYCAWPYIGPPYPFPKIPLGWRSVKLEWEDGHWWFGKTANQHDWWRLRYW